ncbi:Rhs family protein, partial [Candidatus Thiomargarita nelsonii]
MITKHIYNSHGYLTAIQDENSQSYWQAGSLNARGQWEQFTLGNGLQTTKTYDTETGRLSRVQTGTVQDMAFSFDIIGNLIQRKDQQVNVNLQEDFTYDSLNRLTQSTVQGQAPITVSYDALGNITEKSGVGTYIYGQNGAGPHAVTSIIGDKANTYSYDQNGNRLTATGQNIVYSSFNKPTEISEGDTVLRFAYSPEYARYQQTVEKQGDIVEIKT